MREPGTGRQRVTGTEPRTSRRLGWPVLLIALCMAWVSRKKQTAKPVYKGPKVVCGAAPGKQAAIERRLIGSARTGQIPPGQRTGGNNGRNSLAKRDAAGRHALLSQVPSFWVPSLPEVASGRRGRDQSRAHTCNFLASAFFVSRTTVHVLPWPETTTKKVNGHTLPTIANQQPVSTRY